MRDFLVVAAHSLRANLRHRQGIIALAVLVVGILPVFFGMKGAIDQVISQGGWEVAAPLVTNTLGLAGYLVSLLGVVFVGVMLGIGTLTQEKAKGTLEALLAAPLSPGTVWWGKVAASALPATAVGVLLGLGVLWGLNRAAVVPAAGELLLPGPVVVTVAVAVPLLGLGVAAVVNLIGMLVASPNLASLAVVVIVLAVSNVLPRLGLDFAEWGFAAANGGVGLGLLAAAAAAAARFLTKERVVLSARRL